MKKKLFLCVALLAGSMGVWADKVYDIYPVPQEQVAAEGTADFTPTVNVIVESKIDKFTKNRVQEVLAEAGMTAQFSDAEDAALANILLGVNGSGETADNAATALGLDRDVFSKSKYDKHILSLTKKNGNAYLVIIGENTDAVFCGLASLEQIFDNGTTALPLVTINDYADIRDRGVIEGYYGMPYTAEVTKDLFRFMARYKMNTYMYGAKSDIYHSEKWADPYPTTITEQQKKLGYLTQDMLREITDVAHETKVNFIWAIHPGTNFTNSSNTSVVSQIEGKFSKMYDLGVRQFGIFVDDVGVPTDEATLKLNASRLTTIQNWIDSKWNLPGAEPADTVKPLHFVPQLYALSWASTETCKNFFGALGETPDKIRIYITGNAVWTVPNSTDLANANSYLGRNVAWWWNYPCNDNDATKLFPADMYTNFKDESHISNSARLETALKGTETLISNPMQQGEVSKIALFSIADYAWNNAAYDNSKSWEAALPAVATGQYADALKTVIPYLRYYDSDADGTLISKYKSSFSGGLPKADELKAEMKAVNEACTKLCEMETSDNESLRLLYEDMAPWLLKVQAMTQSVQTLLEVAELSKDDAAKWEQYAPQVKAIESLSTDERFNFNQISGMGSGITLQVKGAEPANQTLAPFLNWLKENALGSDFFPNNASTKATFTTNAGASGTTPLANTGIGYIYTTKAVTLEKDQYVGVILPKAAKLASITVADTLLEHFKLLYSSNGKVWNNYNGSDVPQDYVKYLFVLNPSNTPRSLKLSKNVFSFQQPVPTAISSSAVPAHDSFYGDHTEEKFIDGDYSTYTCIYRNQQSGDAYTVTLKEETAVGDVRVYMGTTNQDYPTGARIQVSTDGTNWKSLFIKGTTNINYTLTAAQNVKLNDEVTYCDFDGGGQQAKYVRLYVSSPNTSKWLRLYEIEVNKKAYAQSFQAAAVDNNGEAIDALTDALGYTGYSEADGEIIYHFQKMNPVESVTIYQDATVGSDATVYVTTDDENWTELAPLSDFQQVVDLSAYPYATKIKISWNTSAPLIYEIGETLDESSPIIVSSIKAVGKTKSDVNLSWNGKNLQATGNISRVEIFDVQGRKLLSQQVTGNLAYIPLPRCQHQTVLVSVMDKNGSKRQYKLLTK